MNEIPKNVSESVRRRNPHLYGPVVGAVATSQSKQTAIPALDRGIQKRQKGKGSVVLIITLITCRFRALDDDGNVSALKPLRDAIANSLGLDDGDSRIRWEYGQTETRGEQGVIVKIAHQ